LGPDTNGGTVDKVEKEGATAGVAVAAVLIEEEVGVATAVVEGMVAVVVEAVRFLVQIFCGLLICGGTRGGGIVTLGVVTAEVLILVEEEKAAAKGIRAGIGGLNAGLLTDDDVLGLTGETGGGRVVLVVEEEDAAEELEIGETDTTGNAEPPRIESEGLVVTTVGREVEEEEEEEVVVVEGVKIEDKGVDIGAGGIAVTRFLIFCIVSFPFVIGGE
jgi:hypothetical protein